LGHTSGACILEKKVSPPLGGEYQLMSFGRKYEKREEKKKENVIEKEERLRDKRKIKREKVK
jgi:hypothetical protein